MFLGLKKITQEWLKKNDLPYCYHKWECINQGETRKGHKAIFKCKKCGEILL